MVGINVIVKGRGVFVILVTNTDDSKVVGEVRIVLIHTDRRSDIDSLSVNVGQHLL